jgi:hypothetical protein
MLINPQEPEDIDPTRLLFDYERAQEMVRHYETLFWQVGAIVVAGLFVGLSNFNLQTSVDVDQAARLIGLTLLVLSFWFFWYQRTRALVLPRFRRLREIEEKVAGLRQMSSSYTEDNKRIAIAFWQSPRQWVFTRATHSCLVRLFCLTLPAYLTYLYLQAYSEQRGLDMVTLVNVLLYLVPWTAILLYPEQKLAREFR